DSARDFGNELALAINGGGVEQARRLHEVLLRDVAAMSRSMEGFVIDGLEGGRELRDAYLTYLKGRKNIIEGEFREALKIVSDPALAREQKEARIQPLMTGVEAAENRDLNTLQAAQRVFANRHGLLLR